MLAAAMDSRARPAAVSWRQAKSRSQSSLVAILEQLIHNEGLLVVGTEYSLETGVVDFFDGVPVAG